MENKFQTKAINEDFIDQIVFVHLSAFKNSLMTRLGHNVVRAYYTWQFTDIEKYDKRIFAEGVFHEDKLVAYTIFGLPRNAKIGFLRKYWCTLLFAAVTRFYKIRPREFQEVYAIVKYFFSKLLSFSANVSPVDNTSAGEVFGFLVTACLSEYEGRGLGTLLMRRAEKIAQSKNAVAIRLSVRETNNGALKIYEALGYRKIFDENNIWVGNSMIKYIK